PPKGELRWRAPLPLARWSGTREGLAPGAICPQLATQLGGETSVPRGTPVGDEDCLTLDVWAPRAAPDAVRTGLPVMPWRHGGAHGAAGAKFSEGARLAGRGGSVFVAITYRLGPLGWLSPPALRGPGTSPADASGNYGTLDVLRALEWVRANVAAFGGDP